MASQGQAIEGVRIDEREWRRFQSAVKRIPEKYQRRRVLPVLRKSTPHTISALRRQVSRHDNSGALWDAVGNITGKSKDFPNVLVGYRVGRYRGFHGHLVEKGTKQRFRRRKNTSALGGFSKRGRKKITTGSMPAFGLVEKAAKESEAAAIRELEVQMLRFTEKELKKIFK